MKFGDMILFGLPRRCVEILIVLYCFLPKAEKGQAHLRSPESALFPDTGPDWECLAYLVELIGAHAHHQKQAHAIPKTPMCPQHVAVWSYPENYDDIWLLVVMRVTIRADCGGPADLLFFGVCPVSQPRPEMAISDEMVATFNSQELANLLVERTQPQYLLLVLRLEPTQRLCVSHSSAARSVRL